MTRDLRHQGPRQRDRPDTGCGLWLLHDQLAANLVVESVVGPTLGRIMLICVTFAIFVCILPNQTGSMRMIFAMSRDNGLPLSARLARVNR